VRSYGVTIVAVKRAGQDFTYATADTVIHRDDILIVTGRTEVPPRPWRHGL
jgi:trk system potassium uptake protein TrkA